MIDPAPRPRKPIDWNAIAAGRPVSPADEAAIWAERRAIELERYALEDAVRRAVLAGTSKVAKPYQPPRSILQHPYLPALCTLAMLLVFNYLQG
jgi:hypothetical protein